MRGLGLGFWRLGSEDQRIWDDPHDRARHRLAVASRELLQLVSLMCELSAVRTLGVR